MCPGNFMPSIFPHSVVPPSSSVLAYSKCLLYPKKVYHYLMIGSISLFPDQAQACVLDFREELAPYKRGSLLVLTFLLEKSFRL